MQSQLSSQWERWIIENLERGCSVDDMALSMAVALPELFDHRRIIDTYAERLRTVLDVPLYTKLNSNNVETAGHLSRRVVSLSNPYIQVIDGFLSLDECQALVHEARARMLGCTVVDDATGKPVPHPDRTSSGTMFRRAETTLVQAIELRVSALVGLPVSQFEGLQVMCYAQGQQYRPHYDYFPPHLPGSAVHLRNGGQRILTALMYLSTPYDGGGTSFPELGLTVIPKEGFLTLFSSVHDNGLEDPASLHAGEPVTVGAKWIATIWIRRGEFV